MDRSPARLQRLDDRRNHRRVRTTTGPDRDAVNFDLDDPGIRLRLAAPRFALTAKSGRRHHGVQHRRHKLYFFRVGMPARCSSQLTAPAKQLLRRQSMAPGYRTDGVAARKDFRNNPSLVLVAPLPPTTGSGEDLKTPHWLRDSTMHCVHSKPNGSNKPQTRRSPRHPVGGRRTALTVIRSDPAFIDPLTISLGKLCKRRTRGKITDRGRD